MLPVQIDGRGPRLIEQCGDVLRERVALGGVAGDGCEAVAHLPTAERDIQPRPVWLGNRIDQGFQFLNVGQVRGVGRQRAAAVAVDGDAEIANLVEQRNLAGQNIVDVVGTRHPVVWHVTDQIQRRCLASRQ